MIDLDLRDLTDTIVKLQAACDSLPQVAEKVRGEALGHAIIGANRNVYDTAPGRYQRTQDYLRGFQASGRASRNIATVSVWNTVDYAARLETGSGPHEMTAEQIAAQASANPYAPLYFGRSGQKYSLPGSVVIPAAVFALYRMQELFAQKVRAVVK